MLKLRISGANLDADVDAAARFALDAAAARLAAEVRRTLATPPGGPHETPWRRTGALQASITHATEGDTAVVGSTSSYASAQERGTRTIPPRPFLLPTAQRLAPDLASSIGQAVQIALCGTTTHSAVPDPDGIDQSARSTMIETAPTSSKSDKTAPASTSLQISQSARRNACVIECSELILMKPRSQRPGSFDQCLAHCEGRSFFQNIQPFILFPSE